MTRGVNGPRWTDWTEKVIIVPSQRMSFLLNKKNNILRIVYSMKQESFQ